MSINQEIINANPLWKENIDRWNFLINSYWGGKENKKGEYLQPYMMESAEDYDNYYRYIELNSDEKILDLIEESNILFEYSKFN